MVADAKAQAHAVGCWNDATALVDVSECQGLSQMSDGTYTDAAFPKHRPIRLDAKGMAKLRSQAVTRDGGRCVDCGGRYWLELSHDIPRGRGGSDVLENVHLRCKKCHVAYDIKGPHHF
jgi:hypothetical protein